MQPRYFVRVTQTEARFLVAGSDSIEMVRVTARLGKVSLWSGERAMSTQEFAENISQSLEHGFCEVSQQEYDSQRQSVIHKYELATQEITPAGGRLVDFDQLPDHCGSYFVNHPNKILDIEMRQFAVFDEHCQVSSLEFNFDAEGASPQTARRNLLFASGLTVDGNVDAGNSITALPMFLLVIGDLRARNVILTGWTEVVVTGDLVVSESIIGVDGEAGGRLHVLGNLRAQHVIGGSMYSIAVDGDISADVYWTDDDEPTIAGATIVPTTLDIIAPRENRTVRELSRDAYVEESNWATGDEVRTLNLCPSLLVELVRNGKSPIR